MKSPPIVFDEIGYWSECKLDIVREYAKPYSEILFANPNLNHVYIDGFAGGGVHIARETGDLVLGSPLNALQIIPPFEEYYLIDLDGDKVSQLQALIGERNNVKILHGDCNEVLLQQVFPNVLYENFKRGLCLLDPNGLHLDWKVIQAAGKMQTIDLFLNFPIMDINRNALWQNPEGVPKQGIERLNAYWGDETWRDIAYEESQQLSLFGSNPIKQSNEIIAQAFARRLREKAEFKFVSEPIPMRNTTGATV